MDDTSDDEFAIPALFYTDDQALRIPFDAAPWLTTATPRAIAGLAYIGWGSGMEADAVAQDLAPTNPALRAGLAHARRKRSGYEVHLDDEEARAWVARHRPDALAMIVADELARGPGDTAADEDAASVAVSANDTPGASD